MSVINQMLQDLQRRQGPAGVAGALPPARPVAARAAAGWWGWAAAAALAAALVYVSWGAGSAPPPTAALAPPAPAPHDAPTVATVPAVVAAAELPARTESPGDERAPAPNAEPVARVVSTLPEPDSGIAAAHTTTPLASASTPSRHEAEAAPRMEAVVAPEAGPADEARAVAAGTPPSTASTMQRRARPLSDVERGELAYRRALAELDAGEEQPARAALREALVLAPAHRYAAELLAALLVRAAYHEEAQRVLEAALRHRPGDPGLTQLLAHAHVHAGSVEAAVAVLERQPPPLAAQPEYHALLAALYQQLGRHGAAAQGYRALLQVDPEHAPWWVGLAISLEGRGHWSEALGAYRRALELGTLAADLARYAENRVTVLERARR
ncbi:tetratricopeptide repeat protein [Ectothiorhodospiraceae bacterium 2226]|nr:tetratricopeptide repeat protein [Ectothiorhodospiraceae bacterium 2226]